MKNIGRFCLVVVVCLIGFGTFSCGEKPEDGEGPEEESGECEDSECDESPAPVVTISSGPEEETYDQDAVINFACDSGECSTECRLYEEDWEECASPLVYQDLDPGEYRFDVRGVVEEVTGDPATWRWTVIEEEEEDITYPEVVGLVGPETPWRDSSATLEFECSKPPCEFECRLRGDDQGEVVSDSPCASPHTYEELADDHYTFEVIAIDEDGNQSEEWAQWTWATYTGPPGLTFTDSPEEITYSEEAVFAFHCLYWLDCPVECAHQGPGEDSIEWTADCSSPVSLSGLELGTHSFHIRVEYAPDTYEGVSHTWTVETLQWEEVAVGEAHTCAITSDGALFCWGDNSLGQAGQSSPNTISLPTPVSGTGWTSVSAGQHHTCGTREDGTLWCWGNNGNWQLGISTTATTQFRSPQQVEGTDWERVELYNNHSCALRTDQTLWCWGANGSGQLGLDDTDQRHTPTQVGTEADWLDINAGGRHTCGIRDGGELWCWGRNWHGQLGNGSTNDSEVPVRVGEFSDWTQAALGADSSCALRADGLLHCWGGNSDGQAGTGSTNIRLTTPTEVSAGWDSIAIGGGVPFGNTHTCGRDDEGVLFCWGYNGEGQLGLGGQQDRLVPTEVEEPALIWTRIAVAGRHSCGIDEDGGLYCWGDNESGQLGLGDTSPVSVPAEVSSTGD